MCGLEQGLAELLREIEIDLKKDAEQQERDLILYWSAWEEGYEAGYDDGEPGSDAYQGA